MSSRHVSSAILPAVVASSAVFSLLTLPFFFYHSQPEAVIDSLPLGRELQPIIASQNRDLTIRYIGGALVTSVVTGMATVEIWRRQKDRVAIPAAVPSVPAAEPIVAADWDSELASELPLLTEVTFEPELLAAIAAQPQLDLVEPISGSMTELLATDPEIGEGVGQSCGLITELAEEYATCRIRVKHEHRRQFAIQVAGQYYSFFRLLSTKEAALETARQLSCRAHHVVVTPVEHQYAVWIWQPVTELELVSS